MGKTFANYKSDKRSISRIYKELLYVHILSLSHVRLFVTLWTIAHKAPLSMGFSRQEYWSGLPFPSPGKLPNSGIKHMSPMSPALVHGFFTTEPPTQQKQQKAS